jgi:hypothetical protein
MIKLRDEMDEACSRHEEDEKFVSYFGRETCRENTAVEL